MKAVLITFVLCFVTGAAIAQGADPAADAVRQYRQDMARQSTVAGPPAAIDPAMVTAAQEAIGANLKDPASAQWGAVHAFKTATAGRVDLCGMVNAKNSYGGYAGAEPFHVLMIADGNGWVASDPYLSSPGKRGYFYDEAPICNPASW